MEPKDMIFDESAAPEPEASEPEAADPEPVAEEEAKAEEVVAIPWSEQQPFPLAEPGEYYAGLWSGKPNYKCPYCIYATLDGPDAVELHILAKVDQGNPSHLRALEIK